MTVLAPEQGAPQGSAGSSRRTYAKGFAALLLLLLLAWLSWIVANYFFTGKPLSRIPSVPAPVANLLAEPPRYERSIEGVQQPLGLAIGSNGTVYVTEGAGERRTRSFDSQGRLLMATSPVGSEVGDRKPAYAAVSPNGEVYVSDIVTAQLYRFGSNGEPRGVVPSPFPEGWHPEGVAFDLAGNLYVTDITPGAHRVVVLDPMWKLVRQFGAEGSAQGQFEYPNTLAVDNKGNIYVSDSNNGRVQAFDKEGKHLFTIGQGTSKGNLSNPRGIGVDSGRNLLLVVDSVNARINLYDISAAVPKFVGAAGGTSADDPSSMLFPNGLALDGHGLAYVTDRVNNRVLVWRY